MLLSGTTTSNFYEQEQKRLEQESKPEYVEDYDNSNVILFLQQHEADQAQDKEIEEIEEIEEKGGKRTQRKK